MKSIWTRVPTIPDLIGGDDWERLHNSAPRHRYFDIDEKIRDEVFYTIEEITTTIEEVIKDETDI